MNILKFRSQKELNQAGAGMIIEILQTNPGPSSGLPPEVRRSASIRNWRQRIVKGWSAMRRPPYLISMNMWGLSAAILKAITAICSGIYWAK